jgi:hypothetical protein
VQDVLFVVVVVAFFALAAAVVRLCDRVVGDADAPAPTEQSTTQERRAA